MVVINIFYHENGHNDDNTDNNENTNYTNNNNTVYYSLVESSRV